MNSMHFKILTFAVNGVLRAVVEVELHSRETLVAAVLARGKQGIECLQVLAFFVDCNLGSVTIPFNFCATCLVGVQLLQVVLGGWHCGPSLRAQINGTLVLAATFVALHLKRRPVCTPLFIAPCCGSFFGSIGLGN